MRALDWLKRILKCEGGNVLVIGAATMPLVIGAAALAVDTIQVSVARRQLQRAADSAALAGVRALVQEKDVSAAANRDLDYNDDVALSSAAVVENAPSAGGFAGDPNAVRVVLQAERTVPFIGFFQGSTMSITAEATAARLFEGEYCMVSLEDQSVTGITIGGNTTMNLGCGMITNSPAGIAVNAYGSAVINGSPIAAVGGVPASANYAAGTVRLPYSSPIQDPFEDLPTPTVPSGCNNELRVQPGVTHTVPATDEVSAGVYCYKGMDIKGTVNLQPGIYIIDGNSLGFNSQAVVNGSGVTFVLTHRNAATTPQLIADVSINGGAQLNLTAPDTGTYAGVLMYQDRRAPFGTSHINGNSSTTLRGAIYFPSRELIFNGTAGMQIQCVQMVGRRLGFSGTSEITNTCPAGSGSGGFDATWVRLVA